jgi:hypothetical protein
MKNLSNFDMATVYIIHVKRRKNMIEAFVLFIIYALLRSTSGGSTDKDFREVRNRYVKNDHTLNEVKRIKGRIMRRK